MKPSDGFRQDRDYESLHYQGPRNDAGAQGTALILELQRLQKSLDLGIHDDRQWPPPIDERLDSRHARQPATRRPDDARRRRRSAVGRVVDICLGNGWFSPRVERKVAPKVVSVRPAAAPSVIDPPRPPPRVRKSIAREDKPTILREAKILDVKTLDVRTRDDKTRDGKIKTKHAAAEHRRARPAREATPREAAPREAAPWVDLVREPPNNLERNAGAAVALKALQAPRPDNLLLAPPNPPASDRTKPVRLAVVNAADGIKSACAFLVENGRGTRADDNPDIALAVGVGQAFKGELRTGLRVLIISVGVLGGWATFVPLSGAVVLPGALVVESQVKKVQHPTGGVVTKIDVTDGSHVATGDMVARLDETQARSNYQMFASAGSRRSATVQSSSPRPPRRRRVPATRASGSWWRRNSRCSTPARPRAEARKSCCRAMSANWASRSTASTRRSSRRRSRSL
jgi:HlyD family secretion protein